MKISPNVVVIPTLNEAENIRALLPKLLELDLDIVIVDDASNDGTAAIAHELGEGNGRISIISRPSKLGLGSAYLQGFEKALLLGYENIIQMDADGSHRVEDLTAMLKTIEESQQSDLVIGSRWVPGGRVENWSKHREILSRVANRYSKKVLATSVNDMTAGFRIYRAELLKRMNLSEIESEGYSFQIEMTREALRVGAVVTEVPITFLERTLGTSKMSSTIVREAMLKVTKWGFLREGKFNLGMIGLTLFSAFTTLWGLASVQRSEYYASIAMSMSKNFSNFFFGAIDPAGTVTLDKIPGSYWIPALFVKIFGFSTWAITSPNALATVLFVLVSTYTVKQIFGPAAGLIAGFVIATTPIVTAVARSNQPQSFFLLTLALVAFYATKALEASSRKYLVISGALIALAFHTYMLEAWALWPALIVAWLFTSQRLGKKIMDLLIAGSVSLALSLSWIVTVWLIPSTHRPYVGGTIHNNPFEMVFGYNGLGRFSATSAALSSASDNPNFRSFTPPFGGASGIGRLFNNAVAGQVAWLIPTALISFLVLLLIAKRRASTIFYGLWLVTFFVMFSLVAGIHQFYTSALAFAIAALVGGAITSVLREKRYVLGVLILVSAGISAFVFGRKYPTYLSWAVNVQLGLVFASCLLLFVNLRFSVRNFLPLVLMGSLIFTPAAWALDVKNHTNSINPVAGDGSNAMGGGSMGQGGNRFRGGGFPQGAPRNGGTFPNGGNPPAFGNLGNQGPRPDPFGGRNGAPRGFGGVGGFAQQDNSELITYLTANRNGAKYLLVTFGAQEAASFITATGENVLPVGGFDGQDPTPTLEVFKKRVSSGEIRYVMASRGGNRSGPSGNSSSSTSAEISTWVLSNCTIDSNAPGGSSLYICQNKSSL